AVGGVIQKITVWAKSIVVVGIVLGLIMAAPGVFAQNPSSLVVLPGAAASKTGHTYGQLSAAWWQYVFSIPANPPAYTPNPLFDETGSNCGVGQSASSSPVFFLVGVFNTSGTATRTKCTVPGGKFLFFPMLNAEADNALATTELKQSQLITCAA